MSSDRRAMRLLGLLLVLVGTVGTVATLAGFLIGTDGSALFPASVVVGIIVIVANRPRKA